MKYFKKVKIIHIILIIFFIANLFILTNYPFVHSDESWLSGLSRQILESKNFATTEPFFDLYPRSPHAIKIVFQLIQIVFIKIFSYNIFSFRLISLIAGTVSLYYFYKIAKLMTKSKILSNLAVIILGIDVHFIYSSHLARQEIILILIFLIAAYYHLTKYLPESILNIKKSNYNNDFKKDIILALIIGLSIGVHPNSFIIALPFILIYTYNFFFTKKVKFKNYFAFGSTLAFIAFLFILLSIKFNSSFFINYADYGNRLGVFSSILTKIDRFDYFYKKIFYRVSGTYYIPPIKFQLVLFGITFIFSLIKLYFKKSYKVLFLIASVLGINLGYILIGRYNQTSIIFIFPIFYLLIINLFASIKIKYSSILAFILILILTFTSTQAIINDSHYNYDNYIKNIASVLDPDDKVLANLNTEYYFNNGNLLDYRNLAYLSEHNLTFAEYIEKNNIEYIIYPEEMDFIYNTRPMWNILYGNLYPYYNEMNNYLNKNTKLIHEFTNKTYAMRIVRYIDKKNWKVKIYKVKEPHQSP